MEALAFLLLLFVSAQVLDNSSLTFFPILQCIEYITVKIIFQVFCYNYFIVLL